MFTFLTVSATVLSAVTYAVFRTADESIVFSAAFAVVCAAAVIVIALN